MLYGQEINKAAFPEEVRGNDIGTNYICLCSFGFCFAYLLLDFTRLRSLIWKVKEKMGIKF